MYLRAAHGEDQWVCQVVEETDCVDDEKARVLPLRCSNEKLPRERHHEHSEASWKDSATERYPMKLVTEVLKALRAQLIC